MKCTIMTQELKVSGVVEYMIVKKKHVKVLGEAMNERKKVDISMQIFMHVVLLTCMGFPFVLLVKTLCG